MFNWSHNVIASNVQADFFYGDYFILVYFTKLKISRALLKNVMFIYER